MVKTFTHSPIWFVGQGEKMIPKRISPTELVIENGAVASLHMILAERGLYRCTWSIVHAHGILTLTGLVFMSRRDLEIAFGFEDHMTASGEGLAKHLNYSADAADQGKYFRSGKYLNLPCPGTGMPGDPNLSVLISDAVKTAVADLIE